MSTHTLHLLLHIKKEGDEVQQSPFVMTFENTVDRFGSRLERGGLVEAYFRVGIAFHGQLEQHFVVLKDDQWVMPDYSANAGQSKKRPMENQDRNFDRSTNRVRGRGARGGKIKVIEGQSDKILAKPNQSQNLRAVVMHPAK